MANGPFCGRPGRPGGKGLPPFSLPSMQYAGSARVLSFPPPLFEERSDPFPARCPPARFFSPFLRAAAEHEYADETLPRRQVFLRSAFPDPSPRSMTRLFPPPLLQQRTLPQASRRAALQGFQHSNALETTANSPPPPVGGTDFGLTPSAPYVPLPPPPPFFSRAAGILFFTHFSATSWLGDTHPPQPGAQRPPPTPTDHTFPTSPHDSLCLFFFFLTADPMSVSNAVSILPLSGKKIRPRGTPCFPLSLLCPARVLLPTDTQGRKPHPFPFRPRPTKRFLLFFSRDGSEFLRRRFLWALPVKRASRQPGFFPPPFSFFPLFKKKRPPCLLGSTKSPSSLLPPRLGTPQEVQIHYPAFFPSHFPPAIEKRLNSVGTEMPTFPAFPVGVGRPLSFFFKKAERPMEGIDNIFFSVSLFLGPYRLKWFSLFFFSPFCFGFFSFWWGSFFFFFLGGGGGFLFFSAFLCRRNRSFLHATTTPPLPLPHSGWSEIPPPLLFVRKRVLFLCPGPELLAFSPTRGFFVCCRWRRSFPSASDRVVAASPPLSPSFQSVYLVPVPVWTSRSLLPLYF